MSTVGAFGFIIPDVGDESSTEYMPDQRANWEQVDGHNHDGINSEQVSVSNVTKAPQVLPAASWVLVGSGIYRQLVTMPAGYTYDNAMMKYNLSGGDEFYPTTEKDGASSFYIYINDNTEVVTVRYL